MKTNSIDIVKLRQICKNLEDSSEEILNSLNKLDDLVVLLTNSFKDDESKKIIDEIRNINLVESKKYCNKINSIKNILEKIEMAYQEIDEKFYSNYNLNK